MIYGPAQLPKRAEEIVEAFVEAEDAIVKDSLITKGNFPEPVAEKLKTVWSLNSHCLATSTITRELQLAGFDAKNVFNKCASDTETTVSEGITLVGGIGHLVTKLTAQDDVYFIDPFWQQFMCDEHGVSLDEITDESIEIIQPPDRVLCYTAEDWPVVSEVYAVVMRALQNRVARNPELSTMFTRKPTMLDLVLSYGTKPPVQFHTMAELEAIATQIWHPANFRAISNDALMKL